MRPRPAPSRTDREIILPFPTPGAAVSLTYRAKGGGPVVVALDLEPAGPGEEPIPPGMVVRAVTLCPAAAPAPAPVVPARPSILTPPPRLTPRPA